MRGDPLLIPGQTCWRVARADKLACVIDAADYFRHVKSAMLRAQHRIILIGWDFDARMTLSEATRHLPSRPVGCIPLLAAPASAVARDLSVEIQPAPDSGV